MSFTAWRFKWQVLLKGHGIMNLFSFTELDLTIFLTFSLTTILDFIIFFNIVCFTFRLTSMGALVSCCLKLGLDLRIMTGGSKADRRQNLQSLLSDKDSSMVDGRKSCAPPPNVTQVKEDSYKNRPGSRLGDKGDRPLSSPTSPSNAKPPSAPWSNKDRQRTGSWKRQVSFGTFNEPGRPHSPNSPSSK